MRDWWNRLSPEEKRAKTARRDAARVREQDRRKQLKRRHAGTDEQQLKIAARAAVLKAKKQGVLTPGPCELADETCSGRIEAHHEDYSRSLDVRWLCRSHHDLVPSPSKEVALTPNPRAPESPGREPSAPV